MEINPLHRYNKIITKTMSHDFDTIVIGAGVVGLSVARALSLLKKQVLLIEKEKIIGSGVSSRNSEVIHAEYTTQKKA